VVAATPEGDHPLGDATMWGASVALRMPVTPAMGGAQQSVVSAQVVRAQVADRRARRWRWALELEIASETDPPPSLSLDAIILEWTTGTGLVSLVQSLDLLPAVIPAVLALGYVASVSASSVRIGVHDLGPLTDVVGEAVSCRVRVLYTPVGEPPEFGAARVSMTLAIHPEAISS
jgi:hypothetical protein